MMGWSAGQVVDAILVLVAVEALALLLLHRLTGRGVPPGMLVANLLAGGFLLAALRCGLANAGWPPVAGCLLLALLSHLADMRTRWRQ